MKKYLAFLIFAGLSSCIDAQTVKETVRGKYGENLGTAETTVRGGKRKSLLITCQNLSETKNLCIFAPAIERTAFCASGRSS